MALPIKAKLLLAFFIALLIPHAFARSLREYEVL
jgi:hypothetical protein